MPTYGYECKSCGHTFDVFQSMSDEPLKICPQCGKELRRLINGGTGVIFKGSGFYVTDRKGPAAKTKDAPKSAPSGSGTAANAAAGTGASAGTADKSASGAKTESSPGKSGPAENKAAG
ncbi:MAG: zinc ribbon domain-containing protein [Spirochaetaceae bacterium]|jgi:putative FmdB family regulatory protein|nr:zinc ribbon domain-containing protein [Spirochaetaceae bacterium]